MEGSCKNGNKCPFLHGKQKKGELQKESDDQLAELCDRWGGQRLGTQDGSDASAKAFMWRSQMQRLQPGEKVEFRDLSDVERSCVHDIACSLHFEHVSFGAGSSRVLTVTRPLHAYRERPCMHLEQCISLPPKDADEVCMMLKQILCFHELRKENKEKKKAMETEISKASKLAWTILTSRSRSGNGRAYHSIEDRDALIRKLASFKIQKLGLPNNQMGYKLAAELYDLTFVGDRDADDAVVVDIDHDEPAAMAPLPEPGNPDVLLHVDSERNAGGKDEALHHSETIYIVRYKRRISELFSHVLQQSAGLQECREKLNRALCESESKEHGFIFVDPVIYKEVVRVLDVMDVEARPYIIVISESYKPSFDEMLGQLPYRKRPKEDTKLQQSFHVTTPAPMVDSDNEAAPPAPERSDADSNSLPDGFKVIRTFICTVPLLVDGSTVIQSTTEAVAETSEHHFGYSRGVNPRRYMPPEAL